MTMAIGTSAEVVIGRMLSFIHSPPHPTLLDQWLCHMGITKGTGSAMFL